MSAKVGSEVIPTCKECGASVYKEHLEQGLAGYRAGTLLCVHCYAEEIQPGRDQTAQTVQLDAGAPPPPPPAAEPELSPLTLIEDAESSAGPDAIKLPEAPPPPPEPPPPRPRPAGAPMQALAGGATRARTFHSRLSDGAVAHLDQLINEWCDAHPDISIKFVATTVGVWEGKHAEPNLIVQVFY